MPPKQRWVPFIKQENEYYCGPAVLKMALAAFGIRVSQRRLARLAHKTLRNGTDHRGMCVAVHSFALRTVTQTNARTAELPRYLRQGYPVIVNYRIREDGVMYGHYALVTGLSKRAITLNDPKFGMGHEIPLRTFLANWKNSTGSSKRWFLAVIGPKG